MFLHFLCPFIPNLWFLSPLIPSHSVTGSVLFFNCTFPCFVSLLSFPYLFYFILFPCLLYFSQCLFLETVSQRRIKKDEKNCSQGHQEQPRNVHFRVKPKMFSECEGHFHLYLSKMDRPNTAGVLLLSDGSLVAMWLKKLQHIYGKMVFIKVRTQLWVTEDLSI